MNIRLRRRRFGQLVFASAATVALGNITQKSLAQTGTLLYGVRVDSKGTGVIFQALDLATGQIQDISDRTAKFKLKEKKERLSGFTALADGTFSIATAPKKLDVTGKPDKLSRLFSRLTTEKILEELPGLPQKGAVESLLRTNNGKILNKAEELLTIISLNQGVLPFRLGTINRQDGKLSLTTELELPSNRRFSNLTQSPVNGVIYATSIGSGDSTKLVQFDLVNRSAITGKGKIINLAQLSFNGEPLENDLLSLACSPANQLFALADPTYEGTNSLFLIDVNTGVMTLLTKFDVDKISFPRP